MTPDPPQKLEIDWLKTAGGAFAAVSSAFLLSTLGAAGTIIGAALGSVIVTVGGALYSQGLARSHQRLAQVQIAAMRRVATPRAEGRLHDPRDEPGTPASEPAGPGWRERLVVLPWKRISLVAAGFFAAAVLLITAFELVAGQTISSITGDTDGGGGGPTISRIGGGTDGDTSKEDDQDPSDTPSSPSDAPSTDPSGEPAPTSVPTSEPTTPSETPTPATTPTAPTPTAPTTSEPVVPTDPATTPSTG